MPVRCKVTLFTIKQKISALSVSLVSNHRSVRIAICKRLKVNQVFYRFQISESLKRLRAGKKTSRFAEDIDFENSVANIENRMRISDKILESVGIGSSEVSGARKALQENEERTEKRIARRLNEESGLTKWSVLKADDESAAAQRAKVTRARLSDLEDEMSELNERTAAREKRAARLRALVADSDNAESTMSASKITIRSEREKKQVTF